MLVLGGPFRWCVAAVCVSALSALFCLLLLRQDRKRLHIDISGVGQIRLAVYQDMGGVANEGAVVSLLAGSTLWPGLLLLRLGVAGGGSVAVAIWPGNVAAGAFRPLSVACRAIAARNIELE